jgi:stage II sporulation protein M
MSGHSIARSISRRFIAQGIAPDATGVFLACLGIFLAGLCLGALSLPWLEQYVPWLMQLMYEGVVDEGSDAMTSMNVFIGNIESTFMLLVLGATVILSILVLFVNGFVIGLTVAATAGETGVLAVAAGILPHAIFEVPAALIATTLGLRVGFRLMRPNGQNRLLSCAKAIKEGVRGYFTTVIPLLILGAIIEVYVSKSLFLSFLD